MTLPSGGLSQATVSLGGRMSFQEVQSRVRWNHLAVGVDATLAYISKDGIFTSIVVEKDTLQVQFYPLFEIPQAIQTSTIEKEYPSAISLSSDTWIISDGSGRIYVLRIPSPATSATLLSSSEIISNNSLLPCRLHSATLQENSIIILVSNRGQTNHTSSGKPLVSFDITALRIPITTESREPIQAELLWRKCGTDIPSFVNAQAGNFLICAGSTFTDSTPAASTQPQMEDIRRTSVIEKQPTSTPPPYSWTQTSDSLTIAFPLPSTTPKSHIHVTIGPKHLSVLIKDLLIVDESDQEMEIGENVGKESFPLPRYAMKELWDYVDRDTSIWTWDKEGERTVGLLTLHLEKKHEGTKWSHVFAHQGTSTNDPDVPETVDPSEMYKIRETLEKYTSELSSGSGAEGSGELPSLAQGEMDPAVDSEVGRRVTVSYFDVLTGEEVAVNSSYQEVLSFPLPTAVQDGAGQDARSLFIKTGIDGPLFNGPLVPQVDTWTHTSTFPALAFVLASKRDTRFVFHVNRQAVLALESGGGVSGPNMYIYHDAKGKRQAKQGVVRVGGDGSMGALVGVAGVRVGEKVVLACLREKELVLVRDWM